MLCSSKISCVFLSHGLYLNKKYRSFEPLVVIFLQRRCVFPRVRPLIPAWSPWRLRWCEAVWWPSYASPFHCGADFSEPQSIPWKTDKAFRAHETAESSVQLLSPLTLPSVSESEIIPKERAAPTPNYHSAHPSNPKSRPLECSLSTPVHCLRIRYF